MNFKFQKPKKKELRELFLIFLEENSLNFLKFFTKDELKTLKFTSTAFYYNILSFEIWNSTLNDNFKDFLTTASTFDTPEITKDSAYKQNLYNLIDLNRKSEVMINKATDFKFLTRPQSSKFSFQPKRKSIENTKIVLSSKDKEELEKFLEIWIIELEKMKKLMNIDFVKTDSLVQEVTIWLDVSRQINFLKEDINTKYFHKLEKIMKDKSYSKFPEFQKKITIFYQLKEEIIDHNNKLKILIEDFGDLKEIYFEIISGKINLLNFEKKFAYSVEKTLQVYEKNIGVMHSRILFIFEKFKMILIENIKKNRINLDVLLEQDPKKELEIIKNMEIFEKISSKIYEAFKKVLEETNIYFNNKSPYISHQIFLKKLEFVFMVLNQLGKMKKVLKKLEEKKQIANLGGKNLDFSKKIEYLITVYQNPHLKFDIFDYNEKKNWENVFKNFKNKIQEINSTGEVLKKKSANIEIKPKSSVKLNATEMNWKSLKVNKEKKEVKECEDKVEEYEEFVPGYNITMNWKVV